MNAKNEQQRPTVLVMEPDPLLRWSLTTYLGRSFTVLAVESLEAGREVAGKRLIDAILASDDLTREAKILHGLIRKSNPAVIAIRMVARACGGEVPSEIVPIEKPFELPALAELLWDNLREGAASG